MTSWFARAALPRPAASWLESGTRSDAPSVSFVSLWLYQYSCLFLDLCFAVCRVFSCCAAFFFVLVLEIEFSRGFLLHCELRLAGHRELQREREREVYNTRSSLTSSL